MKELALKYGCNPNQKQMCIRDRTGRGGRSQDFMREERIPLFPRRTVCWGCGKTKRSWK